MLAAKSRACFDDVQFMKRMGHRVFKSLLFLSMGFLGVACMAGDWVVYEGREGGGKGKHVVLLSGDEEYRSEEALPMLGKILAVRHGFNCTVVFPINPKDHTIDPVITTNLPGIEALDSADLCIMSLRFREPPDSQMKHFVDYINAGKPIIALRTSTHAFAFSNKHSPYAKYDWGSKEWPGGFGQQVLGETWVSHHGEHGKESTQGVINEQFKQHPILRGVPELWGPTDVYTVTHLPKDAQVLVWGQVLNGMKRDDPPVEGSKNNPLMPLVWIRAYTADSGKSSKILATTMGAAVDFEDEGLRRLLINGAYWAVGLEGQIPAKANVDYVGEYHPTAFGFGKYKRGVKPEEYEISK
jgi:Trehalose utilisation